MLSNWYFAITIFILGFGFLVFVHELGHFLVAKWMGIRCTQFAMCFGQAVLCWRKGIGVKSGTTEPEYRRRALEHLKSQGNTSVEPSEYEIMKAADELGLGETEYRLNWIPLGGYVKMLGQEDLDPNARSKDPRAYSNKSVGARLAVISAGVIMNVITGFVFFIVAFMIGVKFPAAVVGDVVPGSPAALAFPEGHEDDPAYQGLQPNDRIVAIDGGLTRDMLDVTMNTALSSQGTPMIYSVERAGYDQPLDYVITPKFNNDRGMLQIGVTPAASLIVGGLVQDSDASKAGVKPGMKLTKVDGQPISTYHQLIAIFAVNPDQSHELTFENAKDPSVSSVTVAMSAGRPTLSIGLEGQSNLLGMVPVVTISVVSPDSPAMLGGIEVGDVLQQLGDVAWPTQDDVLSVVSNAGGSALKVIVLRDGETVDLGDIAPGSDGRIGIGMTWQSPRVAKVLPDSPTSKMNLIPGSRIDSINNQTVSDWSQIQSALQQATQSEDNETTQTVTIAFALNVVDSPIETVGVGIPPEVAEQITQASWAGPNDISFMTLMSELIEPNPIAATALGLEKTGQFMVQTYMTLVRLFQGTVAARNLMGPVGIVHHGTIFTQRGWGYFLFFLGLISVNLAVLNFLPIPIVDGGHAVYLLYEKITGKPPGERFQVASLIVGLVLLGSLFLFVTFNDVMRIVTG